LPAIKINLGTKPRPRSCIWGTSYWKSFPQRKTQKSRKWRNNPQLRKWWYEQQQTWIERWTYFTTGTLFRYIIHFEINQLIFVRFIPVFVFRSKWPKTKKSAVLFVYFLYKKSAFCLKMTADFFHFFVTLTKKRKMKWTKH
jgi:hypothetical protein